MKAVKFTKTSRGGCLYNPGDVAAFDDDVADGLIKRGVAKPYSQDTASISSSSAKAIDVKAKS